jgi:hypothetical protein
MNTLRLTLAKLSLAVCSVIFVLLLGEVAARGYFRAVQRVPFFQARTWRDHEFGWEGRRVFGDLQTRRPRVLVVGDSMTNGGGIPDGDLYASVLGRRLNVEVFTYGGSGYGTLQEYLVVDHYLPIVRPDLVLLQVSFNDLINNSFELEGASYQNNNFLLRPYLEGDRIRFRFPSRLGRPAGYSRLAYWLAMETSYASVTLVRMKLLHTVELDMHAEGLDFAPLRRAVETTERIIVKLKARLGLVPLLAFTADGDPRGLWEVVLHNQHVESFGRVPAEVVFAERRFGTPMRLADGAHWNLEGHHVVGELLAERLSNHPSLRRR